MKYDCLCLDDNHITKMTTQVLVSKVSAAQAREAKTPMVNCEETSIFRRSMEKSERQLEQLVEDLRQMSKTPHLALPPIIMASSSSSSSQDGELEASRQLRLVPQSSSAGALHPSPNVSHHHQQQTHSEEGREGGGEAGEQLERSNLSSEVSLVTQTTPHPTQSRGIMPTAQDNATHRHHAGHPAKSKSESGWNKNGGGLVKEYRRENTREYSRESSNQNGQIQLHPSGRVQMPPVQPNELKSPPEGQMQVNSSLSQVDSSALLVNSGMSQVQVDSRSHPDSHMRVNSGVSQDPYDQVEVDFRSHPDCQVNSGVSQLARDSYDQLLATELEIQRLR